MCTSENWAYGCLNFSLENHILLISFPASGLSQAPGWPQVLFPGLAVASWSFCKGNRKRSLLGVLEGRAGTQHCIWGQAAVEVAKTHTGSGMQPYAPSHPTSAPHGLSNTSPVSPLLLHPFLSWGKGGSAWRRKSCFVAGPRADLSPFQGQGCLSGWGPSWSRRICAQASLLPGDLLGAMLG